MDLSTIVEEPGRVPLSVDGWKVARSRREERLMACLRDTEKKVALVKQQYQQLEKLQLSGRVSIEELRKELQVWLYVFCSLRIDTICRFHLCNEGFFKTASCWFAEGEGER